MPKMPTVMCFPRDKPLLPQFLGVLLLQCVPQAAGQRQNKSGDNFTDRSSWLGVFILLPTGWFHICNQRRCTTSTWGNEVSDVVWLWEEGCFPPMRPEFNYLQKHHSCKCFDVPFLLLWGRLRVKYSTNFYLRQARRFTRLSFIQRSTSSVAQNTIDSICQSPHLQQQVHDYMLRFKVKNLHNFNALPLLELILRGWYSIWRGHLICQFYGILSL